MKPKQSLLWKTAMVLAAVIMASCGTLYDPDCAPEYTPTGVLLTFKYKTAPYPVHASNTPEVTGISVFAFSLDEDDLFTDRLDYKEHFVKDGSSMLIPLERGTYHIVVWAGEVKPQYNFFTGAKGESRFGDSYLRLDRDIDGVARSAQGPFYHGEIFEIEVVDGEITTSTVTLDRTTNDFIVTSTGLDRPEYYRWIIKDDNGMMDFSHAILPDRQIIYIPEGDSNGASGEIATMRVNTGNRRPELALQELMTGNTVFSYDLLSDLLLQRPLTQLEYEHYFEIEMEYGPDKNGDFIAFAAIINGWRVVLGEIDLR